MTHLLPLPPTFKTTPPLPKRVRWISAQARISAHYAAVVDDLPFRGGLGNG
jgi:hypothetical protein